MHWWVVQKSPVDAVVVVWAAGGGLLVAGGATHLIDSTTWRKTGINSVDRLGGVVPSMSNVLLQSLKKYETLSSPGSVEIVFHPERPLILVGTDKSSRSPGSCLAAALID